MSAIIIDGKAVSAKMKQELCTRVKALEKDGIGVGLAVIIVGDDPASRVYVNNKEKDCAQCGIASFEYALPEDTTEEELISLIRELNEREDVNGILCQLPLPAPLDENAVIAAISPDKDVDTFHAENVGKLVIGKPAFLPCTPAGVMEMLKAYNISVAGKNCVVIGRSNIVGKPMSMLLLQNDATVTICHSKTKNLKKICLDADVIVSAVGRRNIVTADMVKPGAAVIDVGINRDENGKLCGDVDFDKVKQVAGYITPVPGGCGPMTRVMLVVNTVTAAERQSKKG